MMRSAGINWLAVLAAAVAFYAIGFFLYGMIIGEEQLSAIMGTDPVISKETEEARMPFGVLMPLATAAFMALIFKWGQVTGAGTGARWGAVIALASALPTVWYGWVYGSLPAEMALIDNVHLLLGHLAAGAILGGWK
jgi:hypothetical protein